MNSNECYVLMEKICAKNRQQGYLTQDEFNIYINAAQRSYLDYLLGQYQKYAPFRPIAVVEFGQTKRLRQSLAPLIYGTVLSINNVTGVSPFPSDLEETDNMWSVYGNYNIRFTQQPRLDSFYHSTIDPIEANPVFLIKHEGFQFYPEDIGLARLSYVRTPPAIIWGSQPDFNGIPQYDPATSQDPVWSDTDILNIIVRALAMVGVSMQFGAVVQFANQIKEGGQ